MQHNELLGLLLDLPKVIPALVVRGRVLRPSLVGCQGDRQMAPHRIEMSGSVAVAESAKQAHQVPGLDLLPPVVPLVVVLGMKGADNVLEAGPVTHGNLSVKLLLGQRNRLEEGAPKVRGWVLISSIILSASGSGFAQTKAFRGPRSRFHLPPIMRCSPCAAR